MIALVAVLQTSQLLMSKKKEMTSSCLSAVA